MAFNPELPQASIPNFTGRSQGTGPDRTFETLFEGVANVAQQQVNIRDVNTQEDIRKDAETVFEGTNNEFGLAPPNPTGLDSDLERMSTLQAAVEQGKISRVNYYGRLATLSKQLRSKYPGYEQVVDQTIQSVTGTRPANAYRDAIFAEIDSLQEGASAEQKFQRQYEKENEGVISAIYGDDYFTNPGSYDFGSVRSEVAKFKGKAELIEAETGELTLMSKRGEFNDKRAERALNRDFAFMTEATMNRSLGLNLPSAQQKLDEFIAKGGGSPQELQTFINQISELETGLRTELLTKGRARYVGAGLATNEQLNKAINEALFPITEAKKAVLGGDFKLASKYATLNKAISDQQLNVLLEKSPELRVGAGLAEISNTLGDEFLGSRLDQIDVIADELTGRTMMGNENIVKDTIETGNDRVSKGMMQKSFKAIVAPNLQGPEFSNVIDQYFGPNAIDFMSPKVVAAEDLEKIYLDFLRPEVTRAVFEKGTDEDKEKYTEWAYSKALSIPAFRAAAGDINTLKTLGANIQFDPKTMRLQLTAPDGATRTITGGQPYARATNAFNKVLQTLRPIIEANGGDPIEETKRIVKDFAIELEGVNPEAVKARAENEEGVLSTITNSTFWGSIWEELSKPLGEATGRDTPVFEGTSPQEDSDFDGIDFMFEQEEYDVLDEDLPEEAPSPSGRIEPLGFVGGQARGLEALVSSNARGYNPDTQNLRPELSQGIVELQSAWGRPLPIVSGYRDPARNRKAGGAKRSQHMHGNAVDIDVRNLSREERIELIKLARKNGFNGIGVYPNSLHLDKGGRRAWGPNYRSTSLPKWAREVL